MCLYIFSNNTADWSVTIDEKLVQSSQMSQCITVLTKTGQFLTLPVLFTVPV